MKPKNFFAELKRRKVYRAAIAYAAIAWLLVQIATQTFPFFDVPTWAVRLLMLLLAFGFPIVLLLAWAYELTPEGMKRTDETDARERAPVLPVAPPREAIPDKSIAVLPFENLSDSQENAYFADGIQDDILSNLSKIADLKVISRTSVRQYRTGTRNLREIGEALGVAHVLEGTVRRSGNRVRVNVQLINARNDAHIWADTFDREMLDLFTLQSELAERITWALRANLSPREKEGLKMHSTSDFEAYESYLRARDLFRWAGAGDPRENGEKALRFLEHAIRRDPQFALAYCMTSRWHAELFWFGYDRSPARLADAKRAADKALSLQPYLSDARLALGSYYYFGYRDYERARAELELAAQGSPNDAEVWDVVAAIDRRQGRWADSLANFERARELDPRNQSVIWNAAETCAVLGRYAEAEAAIAAGLAVYPNAHFFSLLRATIALRRKGATSPLREALRKIPAKFNPGGGVTLVALRLSIMERDFAEGARLLASSAQARFNDPGLGGTAGMLDGYAFPRSWYEGLVARGLGDQEAATGAFQGALQAVERDLDCSPNDEKAVMMLALVHAALGQKEDAMREGARAVALVPISRDAYEGPVLSTNLAAIYAQLGETDRALVQLGALRGLPMAPTAGGLRIEPQWDPLRGDPRFEKLLSL